jgi:hypothetical protein
MNTQCFEILFFITLPARNTGIPFGISSIRVFVIAFQWGLVLPHTTPELLFFFYNGLDICTGSKVFCG